MITLVIVVMLGRLTSEWRLLNGYDMAVRMVVGCMY